MRKFVVFLFFLALISPCSSCSQQPDISNLAERFLVVTKKKEQNEKLMNMIQTQMTNQMNELATMKNLKGKKQELLKKYSEKLANILVEELSWENTKENHIQVIKSVYTEGELKKLIEFFETDLGKLYADKQQVAVQMLAQSSQPLMENVKRRLQELSLEMREEFK